MLTMLILGCPDPARPQNATPAATVADTSVSDVEPLPSLVFRKDLEQTLQEAEQSGRRVVILFRSQRSPWSLALEQRIVKDPTAGNALKSLFVVLVDGDEAPKVAERFHVADFPVLVLAEPSGKEIGRIFGYASAEDIASGVVALLAKTDELPLETPEELEPPTVETLFEQMYELRQRGRLQAASESARKILELDPGNQSGMTDNSLAFLGLLESRLGNWERAYAIYSRIEDLYPRTEIRSHLLISLGYSAAKTGRTQEAIEAYERFTREFPKHEDSPFAKTEIRLLKRIRAQSLEPTSP